MMDDWEERFCGPCGIQYGVWIPRDPDTIKKKDEQKASEPPKAPANDWIKIKVVDDQSGEGIPKVVLDLKTPDNSTEQHETRLSGLIESLGLESGNCGLSDDLTDLTIDNSLVFVGIGDSPIGKQGASPFRPGKLPAPVPGSKYRIAIVDEHKVKTGETLKSIAASTGMTWQALAKFNWETDNPEEINKHLHWSVGCTKKTADGKNYILDDSDFPGIVYVPKKLNQRELATNQQHVIRVKHMLGDLYFRLCINPNEAKSSDDKFRLFSADNTYEQIKTIQNDTTPGDDYLDLAFTDVPIGLKYSFEIDPGKEGTPYLVFKEIPYRRLHSSSLLEEI
jgi:hypothetical protein